jgi:hypothetical protein
MTLLIFSPEKIFGDKIFSFYTEDSLSTKDCRGKFLGKLFCPKKKFLCRSGSMRKSKESGFPRLDSVFPLEKITSVLKYGLKSS